MTTRHQARRPRSARFIRAVDVACLLFVVLFVAYLAGHIVGAVVGALARSVAP